MNDTNCTLISSSRNDSKYDYDGALCYVIAVLLFYSLSIFLIIASLARRSRAQDAVLDYIREVRANRRLELKQQKEQVRRALREKWRSVANRALSSKKFSNLVTITVNKKRIPERTIDIEQDFRICMSTDVSANSLITIPEDISVDKLIKKSISEEY